MSQSSSPLTNSGDLFVGDPVAFSGGVGQLGERYAAALEEYLRGAGESALESAYEIGRQALSDGLSVLEMVAIHRDALSKVLTRLLATEVGMLEPSDQEGKAALHLVGTPERLRLVKSLEGFLDESLMPFEITYRGYREANAGLRASEERYRELFENANDIIFTTDLLGNFTSLNRAGERLSGYSRDEARRMNFGELCAPECQDLALRMLDRKITGEGPVPYELEFLTRDGRRVPVEISCQVVCRDGRPFGIQAIARDITERQRARESLRRLNEALEQEAKRIAHALHDEAGQLLASVHIALESVARDLPSGQGNRVREVQGLLNEIEDQLRRLSHELRPTILDDLGLVPAVEFLSQGISARMGIPIEVEGRGVGRLPADVETVVYRVVQEALNNASKYAKARNISILLACERAEFSCCVRDDGIGFNLPAALSGSGERGFGLIQMRERLRSVGGTCVITTSPNHGTEVLIAVPLESEHAA